MCDGIAVSKAHRVRRLITSKTTKIKENEKTCVLDDGIAGTELNKLPASGEKRVTRRNAEGQESWGRF